MTWNDITVEQYQRVASILSDTKLNGLEREAAAIAALCGIPEDEFDAMPFEEYRELRKRYEFLHTGEIIPGSAVKYIHVKGKRYRVVHDLREMPVARYVEVKHFSSDKFIDNLHLLMASIVVPEKGEYKVKDHSLYAEDMKQARFIDVYNTALFFCELFSKTIASIPDFLETQLMNQLLLNREQAKQYARDLCSVLAGYTTSSK
jgi:hypothetical protein